MTVTHSARYCGAAASFLALLLPLAAHADGDHGYLRAAAPEGAIEHFILVINLEEMRVENADLPAAARQVPLPAVTPTI